MTLKEKVGVAAWALFAGGIASLLGIAVASISPTRTLIYWVTLVGSIVFGGLVAAGFAWFLAVILRELSSHHSKHQDILFVSDRDRLIDRSRRASAASSPRIVPPSYVNPEILDLESLDYQTRQAFRNGGSIQ